MYIHTWKYLGRRNFWLCYECDIWLWTSVLLVPASGAPSVWWRGGPSWFLRAGPPLSHVRRGSVSCLLHPNISQQPYHVISSLLTPKLSVGSAVLLSAVLLAFMTLPLSQPTFQPDHNSFNPNQSFPSTTLGVTPSAPAPSPPAKTLSHSSLSTPWNAVKSAFWKHSCPYKCWLADS